MSLQSCNNTFNKFANRATKFTGSSLAFIIASLMVVVWLIAGPFCSWSTTHALLLNDVTTVVTYLMVFLIQTSSNRDNLALHLKIDELIKATEAANNRLRGIEQLNEEEINKIKEEIK